MLTTLRSLLVLKRAVHGQFNYLVFRLHLLKLDLLLLLCQFHEDIAGDEGKSSTLITIAACPAHSVDIGCGTHFTLALSGLAVVDHQSYSSDVNAATDSLCSKQNLDFFVPEHCDSGSLGSAAVLRVVVFIAHIADGSTSSVDVVDIDVIFASLRGTLVIDDKLVLLCLKKVVELKKLRDRIEKDDDLWLGFDF